MRSEPDLAVRPATSQDADVLARLFWDARAAAYPSMPRTVHTLQETEHWFREVLGAESRTMAIPEGRETWVAEHSHEVVGYLVLDPEWLDSLYVRPDLTGGGIGTTLLDVAKGLRRDGFGLWVFESNTDARRFYERHGLIALRRTDGTENEERAPDVEMLWPGAEPLAGIRARIDALDDRLARLLDERSRLTAVAQQLKEVPGPAGRDAAREDEIVARMAAVAPELGPERLRRIMHQVISESLDAAEQPEQPE
jgi:chorismate mutase/GNAT superfamily N-acetyltransferase